jgi:mRNA interferase RelE/StbE
MVEWSPGAERDLGRFDPQNAGRIVRFLNERLTSLENPRALGEPLVGRQFGEFWRYRVGNYRILCRIADERVVIVVVKVGIDVRFIGSAFC